MLVARCRLALVFGIAMFSFVPPVVSQEPCSRPGTLTRELVYDDARDPLDRVRSVVLDRSGKVIVSESDGKSLKVFSSDGKFVARWGKAGEGPGEFRSVISLVSVGDSVWAFDDRLRRGTFFRLDGTVGKIVTFGQALPRSQTFGEVYPLGANYVVFPGLVSSELANAQGFRRSLFVVAPEGNIPPREIAPPVLMRNVLVPISLPSGGTTNLSSPTPRSDRAVVRPGGTELVIVRGEVQTSGRRFVVITRIGPRGDTIDARREEVPRAAVDRRYVEQQLDDAATAFQRFFPSATAARNAVRENWKADEHFWPVGWMFVDNDGRAWIRSNPVTNVWIGFAATGSTCVDAPAETRLVAATADKFWVIRTDSDGVQYLERYALTAGR